MAGTPSFGCSSWTERPRVEIWFLEPFVNFPVEGCGLTHEISEDDRIMMGSLWYSLTLWSEMEKELHKIKMLMVDFLWDVSARCRINLPAFSSKERWHWCLVFRASGGGAGCTFLFLRVRGRISSLTNLVPFSDSVVIFS